MQYEIFDFMDKRQQQLQSKITKFIQSIPTKDTNIIQYHIQALQQQNQQQQQPQQLQQLHQSVKANLPIQTISTYHQLKRKQRQNQDIIKIVQKGKLIASSVQLITSSTTNIQQIHQVFVKTIQSLDEFQQLSSLIQSSINFGTLREQLYMQMIAKIGKSIHSSQQLASKFKKIITANSLPLKKDQTRKDELSKEDHHFITYCLYRQSCLISTKRYLLGLVQRQQNNIEESILSLYWEQCIKRVAYLFVSNTELRSLEQPSWMFEYMQQLLNNNYKFVFEFICKKDMKQEICTSISRHFLNHTFTCFFSHVTIMRFEKDLPSLNQYLIFNFIDELAKVQQKLASSFSIRPLLVQSLIIHFDHSHQILNKALEYEQKWFETKIFEDFINIDYSKVNLKNLDAYNIVSSFLSLFQRLYHKYINIQQSKAKQKIFKFYQKQVMNLIAHVKTSFDRIYNHSKLPKIDVLLSFKRIENQLRAILADFIGKCPHLEEELQNQYYTFLAQYFQVCALEAVTPTHKKLHISLGDIMPYLGNSQENDHSKYINSFNKIFEEWEAKMQQILKFAAFSDSKVRSIFFKYLQATNFSSVGLNLYLKIFEPYLRVLFSEDRHRVLLSLITMSQQSFNEYIQSHSSFLQFLSAQQKKQVKAFKKSILVD